VITLAIKINFLDGLSYLPQDLINQMKSLLNDGVYSVSGGALNVLAHSPANLSVDVQIGSAQLKGYYINSDTIVNVAIAANTSGYNRIDIIVLEINTTTKATTFKAVQGTPSSSPTAPLPTNTSTIMQFKLAEVYVGNNVSVINQVNITDKRINVDLFGAQLAEKANRTQENWIAPILLNGWSNMGAPNAVAGYMKSTLGFVHIKAVLKNGVTADSTIIFTLPVGYRPSEYIYSVVTYNNGTTDALALIAIAPNGNITLSGVKANNTLVISTIIFKAEQ
jgi:hypothetical protein